MTRERNTRVPAREELSRLCRGFEWDEVAAFGEHVKLGDLCER